MAGSLLVLTFFSILLITLLTFFCGPVRGLVFGTASVVAKVALAIYVSLFLTGVIIVVSLPIYCAVTGQDMESVVRENL
jgi:hypothetical protein